MEYNVSDTYTLDDAIVKINEILELVPQFCDALNKYEIKISDYLKELESLDVKCQYERFLEYVHEIDKDCSHIKYKIDFMKQIIMSMANKNAAIHSILKYLDIFSYNTFTLKKSRGSGGGSVLSLYDGYIATIPIKFYLADFTYYDSELSKQRTEDAVNFIKQLTAAILDGEKRAHYHVSL